MQFARNGYVKILVDDHDTDSITTLKKKPRVGKWRIGHSGVAFDIPVQRARDVSQRAAAVNNNLD